MNAILCGSLNVKRKTLITTLKSNFLKKLLAATYNKFNVLSKQQTALESGALEDNSKSL